MEQLLTICFDDLNQKIISLSQRSFAANAMRLFDEIQQKYGGNQTFIGSKGSFGRFKQSSQILCVKIGGEAVSDDIEATRVFVADFKKIIVGNDFPPDLLFNVDETGL